MTIRLHSDLSDTISENSRVAATTRRTTTGRATTRRRETDRPTDRGDDDDDLFERGFRVDFDGGAAAENSTEWEKKKFMQDVQFSRKFESKSDPDPGQGADRARAPLG